MNRVVFQRQTKVAEFVIYFPTCFLCVFPFFLSEISILEYIDVPIRFLFSPPFWAGGSLGPSRKDFLEPSNLKRNLVPKAT